MFQAIHEQRAVRQPGKQIVERLITELLYQGFAFGDVPGVDHHTPHSRVVDQVVYDMLKVAPGAILVGHSELQGRLKPRSFQDLGERVQRLLPVIRMDRAECVGPYLLFRPVARHPLDCRAYVVDGAFGVEDRDDIGAVLYQRAEALFAFFDCFLDLLAFAHVLYLADEVERLVLLVVHYRDAEERPHHVSVFVEVPFLRLVSPDHSDQEPPEVLQIDLQIIGMGYLLEGLPQQLPFRVAEYLAQRPVHPQEAPVGSNQRHPCGRTFEGTPEALLAVCERTLGPLALGDILDLGDEVERLALSIPDEGNAQRSPHRVAVSVEKALLQVVPGELAFHNPARISRTGCQIVGVSNLLPREGLQLFLGVPEYFAKRAVHLQVSPFEADHGHADRCVIEDASEAISCLAQRILGSLALGDVADYTCEQPLPILLGFTEGHLDRELAAVFTQPY